MVSFGKHWLGYIRELMLWTLNLHALNTALTADFPYPLFHFLLFSNVNNANNNWKNV